MDVLRGSEGPKKRRGGRGLRKGEERVKNEEGKERGEVEGGGGREMKVTIEFCQRYMKSCASSSLFGWS